MEWKAVVAGAILLLAWMSPVAAKSVRCDECSYADLRWDVEYLGDGEHTVYNTVTGQVRTFEVTGWRGRPIELETPGITVREIQTDGNVVGAVAFLVYFSPATAGTMKTAVEVPAGSLGVSGLDNATAYDVMSDFNLKSRLADRLVKELPTAPQLDRLADRGIQAGLSKLGLSDQIAVEITVVMKDGSRLVFVDKISVTSAIYQPGRSRTANGQAIPESNSSEYQGNWSGGNGAGSDDLNQMAGYLGRLGIPVSVCGSPIKQLTCSFYIDEKGQSNTLRCESRCQ